ncbi:unnamed protein product [Mytilus coruscus]|uniref:Protein-tyrosine-phosphatase n=1 Tax=Mytilus coruscus TaxID=42192 RepID=A0A6J8AYD3_MYTCO|nr:unnamed protein product [Mytilus coruscus]
MIHINTGLFNIYISGISTEATITKTESKGRGIRAALVYTSQKGGDVTIKCDRKFTESQLGKGYTIKWTKNHYTVISNLSTSDVVTGKDFTGRVEIVNGTSLKISRLKTQDARYYQCSVKLLNRGNPIVGSWIQLKLNNDPVPSTTQPTFKPVSIKSNTNTPTTATIVVTPLSVTTNTARDVDGGGGGGDDTESDGSGKVKVNTDLSEDQPKGTPSMDEVTEPRTTTVLDVESQSVKVSTEITTVESTQDTMQKLSNESSVDTKVQSVTPVGLEQDLPTKDITSETLTRQLTEKLHTEMSISPKFTNSPSVNKKSLIGNVHESTYELDVETTAGIVPKHITTTIVDGFSDSEISGYGNIKFTTDKGQSKTDISESNTHTKKVSLSTASMLSHPSTKSLTEAAIKTTIQSKQEHKMPTETKSEKTTTSRNGNSSPSVDITRTRISTETTPEPVIITEAAIKTTNQSEQEHKMPTETKSEKTTISRNGTSSPNVDITRTRISTETTTESVIITEAAVKTTNQSEQEHKTPTETKTEKTIISRNRTSSQSVDITRTRISTETTTEPVIITEAADKTETNSLDMDELNTASSVKVSMTTLSEKESYETSTTLQQLQTTTDSAFTSQTSGTGNWLQGSPTKQRSTQTSGESIPKIISTSTQLYLTTKDNTLTPDFETRNTTESFNIKGDTSFINVTNSGDLKINSVNKSKSDLSTDLSTNVLNTSSFTVHENNLSSVNVEYSSDIIDNSVNRNQSDISFSDLLSPTTSSGTDMQGSTSSSVILSKQHESTTTIEAGEIPSVEYSVLESASGITTDQLKTFVTAADRVKTGTPSGRIFFNTTIEKEREKSSTVHLSSGVSVVTPLYNSISNKSSAYVNADLVTSKAVSTDNVMSDKLSSTYDMNSYEEKKNSSFTSTSNTTMKTTALNSSVTTANDVGSSGKNIISTTNITSSDQGGTYDIESIKSTIFHDNTVVPIHTLSTNMDTKVNYPTLDSVTDASSTSERVLTSIQTTKEEAEWETSTTIEFAPATDKPPKPFTQSQRLSSQSSDFVTYIIESSSDIVTSSPEPSIKYPRNLITTEKTKTSEMLNKLTSQYNLVSEELSTVTEDNPSKESSQGLSVAEEMSTVTENNTSKESTKGFSVSDELSTVTEDNPSKESSQGLSVSKELSTIAEDNPSKESSQGLSVAEELSGVTVDNPSKESFQGLSVTEELSTVSEDNTSKRLSHGLSVSQEMSTFTEENTSKGLSQDLSVTEELSTVTEDNPSKGPSQSLSEEGWLSTVTEDNISKGSSQGLSVTEELSIFIEEKTIKGLSQGLSVVGELSTVTEESLSIVSSQGLPVSEELSTVTKDNSSKESYQGLTVSEELSTVTEYNPSEESSQGLSVTKELSTVTGDMSREISNPDFSVSHDIAIELTSPLSSTVKIEGSSIISEEPPSQAYIEQITTEDMSSDLTTPNLSSSTVCVDADDVVSKNVTDQMSNILTSPNSLPSKEISEDISKYESSSAFVVKDITHEMTTQSFLQQNSETMGISYGSSSSAIQTKTTYKSEDFEMSTGQSTQGGSLQNTTMIATKLPITTVPPYIEATSQFYGTTTFSIITGTKGLFFNVTITERKLNVIKLQVRVSSTKGEKFTKLKCLYKTVENSTRTEEIPVKGHNIDEIIRVRGLEIGLCYNFQIDVQTQNGRWIGPIYQKACTKPRAPGSGTHIGKNTTTSISLLIEHPNEEHFDSFRIDYENNAKMLSMTVNRSFDGSETETEITGLVPESCYNIDVYTVSFSELNHNSRSFVNVCTLAPLDPNNYTVIYGESSFIISWVNFSDKYHVNVSCNSWTKMFSLKTPSLSVNRTLPGDCCVLNVKNWNDTVSRKYYVHVNETLPEYPVVISNVTTKTHLNLTWREPMRSNGWIIGYTVHLFDSKDITIENFNISCIQAEPKCSKNDSDWKFQKYQCSSFSLVNNRNANIYYNNSQVHLSIGGLKPGMLYQYIITAMNKAGSNTTDRIPVITLEDKPESPASLDITVLNVTTMNVMWSPPNVTNGVITGYNVSYCSNGSSGCKDIIVERMTSVILKDLDCWKEYLVCVSAQTSAGVGRSTCGVNNTSVYEPQSKISKITASNTTIRLDFEMPCDNVEAPISYNISYTSLDHSCTGDQTNVTDWTECFPFRPCEITGLFPYWDYFIKVQESAENNVGVWSNEYKVTTLHSVPEKVRNIRVENIESDRLTVCWEQPCFLNSDTVFYNVTLDEDIPYIMISRSGSILETECANISDLLPYTNYNISVTASNQYGKTYPVVIMEQTDIAVPNQPSFGRVLEHPTMMTVEWKPPYPYPGPTRYTVKVRDTQNSETQYCQTSVYKQTRCSVYGLEEYWEYEVTITAHTERGNKQYKHPHVIRTKQSAPGPVTHLRVNHEKDPEKPRQVFITFGPPVYRDRNGVIKAYYVRCHDTRTYRDIQVVSTKKTYYVRCHDTRTYRDIQVVSAKKAYYVRCHDTIIYRDIHVVSTKKAYYVRCHDTRTYRDIHVVSSKKVYYVRCHDTRTYRDIHVVSTKKVYYVRCHDTNTYRDIHVVRTKKVYYVKCHDTRTYRDIHVVSSKKVYYVRCHDTRTYRDIHVVSTKKVYYVRCHDTRTYRDIYIVSSKKVYYVRCHDTRTYEDIHVVSTKKVYYVRCHDTRTYRDIHVVSSKKVYYVRCHDTRTYRDIHVVSTKKAYYVRCHDTNTYRDIHVVRTKKVYYV